MYFAFDIPSPEIVPKITDELRALQVDRAEERINAFVLIDGAFDEGFFLKCFKKFSRVSLYEGTDLRHLEEAAPFLVQVPEVELENGRYLENLIGVARNRPMWSVIATPLDIGALAKHFCRYIICRSDDSLEWPVRWGDARVLPELMHAFEPELVADLMRPICGWFTASRTGQALVWYGEGKIDYGCPGYEQVPLSDKTLKDLVEASEADAILSIISDTQPELLKSRLPSECHRLILRQLKIADKYNIEQARVRKHFATLGLIFHENFAELGEIRKILERTQSEFDYVSGINGLPAHFWGGNESTL